MHSTALAIDEFGQRLSDYEEWRTNLTVAIESYQKWYDSQSQLEHDTGQDLRLLELIEELRSDTLTIALVGEFSRGKTELINAVFFADYHKRLLPSTPGRTTMCPTEILYEERVEPCIRLLPIESRKSSLSIAQLKKTPIHWTTLPLNLNSAEEMSETLQEIVRSKEINQREAEQLGLLKLSDGAGDPGATIEIPNWRHAIINYPHQLLKRGLVVLDTPGLNALGAEPELTLGMLPQAHAILFVLAADTGVTKTDMDVWKNHVCVATHGNAESCIAALNKIDTLWDELQSEAETNGFIQRQVEETRRLLGVDRSVVFPVSAQKGLIGKIRNDKNLVSKSGLLNLETRLSEDIIVSKQKIIRDKIVGEIGAVVSASHGIVAGRIGNLHVEFTEISELSGKSTNVIEDMTEKLRSQKDIYEREVQSFQVTRRVLSDQVKKLLGQLSMTRFDQLIMKTRLVMRNSWTTAGLRYGMQEFFGHTLKDLAKVEKQANEICGLVDEIYQRFHAEHGLPRMRPIRFSAASYMRQYQHLYEDAENFRNSPTMLATEQHFVMKKFFITLVSRARSIYQDCNASARNWAKAVLTPIYTQIKEHKIMIDRRLENLEKLRGNHASLRERVRDIEKEMNELKHQRDLMNNILDNIQQNPAN